MADVEETIKNFNLKDGLSIDEAKVSALILCLVICFIFVLVKYQLDGDISDNSLTAILAITLYWCSKLWLRPWPA